MGRSQESFGKKELEKKRQKKKQDKLDRKEARKANSTGGNFEDMMAYVDEFGNIIDSAPDPSKKTSIDPDTIEVSVPKKEDLKEENNGPLEGRVEFFNDSKGFGFIKQLNSTEKFFVHISGLIDPVAEGDMVQFQLAQGKKGLNAVEVRKI